MAKMFNIKKLVLGVCSSENNARDWAIEQGLLPSEKECPKCRRDRGNMMYLQMKPGGIGEFRCKRHDPTFTTSLFDKSWFEGTKMTIDKVILLTYCISHRFSQVDTIRETSSDDKTTSTKTVADWNSFAREVMMIDLDQHYDGGQIGGPGKVVEIDESKIGKRKYNVGRVIEGSWIFGMIEIEDDGELRLEICPDNRRDKDTLLALIKKHIAPGTMIMSDCWKAYNCLHDEGFDHLTVNHTYNFVDPDTWANTQKIESNWRPLKKRLTRGGVHQKNLADHICEFLWFRLHKNDEDIFLSLISAIKKVYSNTRFV